MNSETLYFAKEYDSAILPSKKVGDAGYDFYAVFDEDSIRIPPSEIVIISTGIAVLFPSDYVMFVKERSSTGKVGMAIRMGVVDSSYRGSIKIAINNTTNIPIIIDKNVEEVKISDLEVRYPYCKAIAQGVLCSIPKFEIAEMSWQEYSRNESERGQQMFGSSGK